MVARSVGIESGRARVERCECCIKTNRGKREWQIAKNFDVWEKESERAWKEDNKDLMFPDTVLGWLRKYVPVPATVLDAGCAIGKFVKLFKRLGYECIGIEQSITGVRYARQFVPEAVIIWDRIQNLDKHFERGIFDIIFTSAVIQHNTHERKKVLLGQFKHVLKPRGYYLMTECTIRLEKGQKEDGYSFTKEHYVDFMKEQGFALLEYVDPWPFYLWRLSS